jgi:hypothetical protein
MKGKMMIKNLKKRNCPLLSIYKYPEIEDQCKRFLDHSYSNSFGKNMYDFYKLINSDTRNKIEKIEMFDEYEEWELIMKHYCIVISWNYKGDEDLNDKFIFKY